MQHFGTQIPLFGSFGRLRAEGKDKFEFFLITFEAVFFNFSWAKRNEFFLKILVCPHSKIAKHRSKKIEILALNLKLKKGYQSKFEY